MAWYPPKVYAAAAALAAKANISYSQALELTKAAYDEQTSMLRRIVDSVDAAVDFVVEILGVVFNVVEIAMALIVIIGIFLL